VSAIAIWLIAFPAAVLGLWVSQPAVQSEGGVLMEARSSEHAATVVLACSVLLHGLLLIARVPQMLSLYVRAEQLVASFGHSERASAAEFICMKGLLRCQSQRILQCVSAFLLLCHSGVVILTCASLNDPLTCRCWQLRGNSCQAMLSVQVSVCGLSMSLNAMILALGSICSGALPWYERHLAVHETKFRLDARELPCYRFERSVEDGDALTCAICADDVRPGEMVRKLMCGHRYHQRCIDTWLHHSPTCPMRCHRAVNLEAVDGQ
jgi:hypothetical protein